MVLERRQEGDQRVAEARDPVRRELLEVAEIDQHPDDRLAGPVVRAAQDAGLEDPQRRERDRRDRRGRRAWWSDSSSAGASAWSSRSARPSRSRSPSCALGMGRQCKARRSCPGATPRHVFGPKPAESCSPRRFRAYRSRVRAGGSLRTAFGHRSVSPSRVLALRHGTSSAGRGGRHVEPGEDYCQSADRRSTFLQAAAAARRFGDGRSTFFGGKVDAQRGNDAGRRFVDRQSTRQGRRCRSGG